MVWICEIWIWFLQIYGFHQFIVIRHGHKFLRLFVQKAIRSSKRRFAEDHLNNEKNIKQWWDTVKILTNNCKNNKKIKDFSVIDNERQSNDQLAKNLNHYYKGVGGDAVPSNDVLHHSNSSPLQPLRIGEVKILLNTIDTPKATCAVQTTSKAGCPKKGR